MATQFSWIPFYRELTQRLLTYEDKQSELIGLLEAMRADGLPVMFLSEDLPGGGRAPLTVMEPFTFMMNLNITAAPNARLLCQWLKTRLQLGSAVPDDFDGLPTFMARSPWFFWSADERKPEDIPRLWQLARAAWGADASHIDKELFRQCLAIKGVGIGKLTTGLYWFSPTGFVPLVTTVLAFLKARGVTWDQAALLKGDLDEYRSLIAKANQVNFNHPQLARDAWLWSQNDSTERGKLPHFPLNTILYGPPGCGKTFQSVARAVEIIDGVAPEDRDECVARFEELRALKQIGFVTFHQTFAYEEFIEGLRPVVDDDVEGGARYAVRDGIFKEMALRALGAMLEPTHPRHVTFEQVWEAFVEKVKANPDQLYPGLISGDYKIAIKSPDDVCGENTTGNSKMTGTTSRQQLELAWQKLDRRFGGTHNVLHPILGDGAHTYLVGTIIEELRRLEKTLRPDTAQVSAPTESAKSFLRGLQEYHLAPLNTMPRFVLIVDEINRGNISKIFGELITLLEEDKRLWETNALRVLLPYSGDTFALPPNLYLLGTMNTADKSLALLDVALRRRFSFQELNPDFSICKLPDPAMQQVLEALNRRIMLVLDREHRIGHAFFMGVKTVDDFNAVFADKIVPLLQEYFYNDWDGLRGVLGEKDAGKIVGTMLPIEGVRGRNHYAWWHDLGQPTPDFLAVLRKNYGITGGAPSLPEAANTATTTEAPVPDADPTPA